MVGRVVLGSFDMLEHKPRRRHRTPLSEAEATMGAWTSPHPNGFWPTGGRFAQLLGPQRVEPIIVAELWTPSMCRIQHQRHHDVLRRMSFRDKLLYLGVGGSLGGHNKLR